MSFLILEISSLFLTAPQGSGESSQLFKYYSTSRLSRLKSVLCPSTGKAEKRGKGLNLYLSKRRCPVKRGQKSYLDRLKKFTAKPLFRLDVYFE